VDEVGAGGDPPGVRRHPRDGAHRQRAVVVAVECASDLDRLERRRRHALPVQRVEAGHRVTNRHEPARRPQASPVPPFAGREAVPPRRRQPLALEQPGHHRVGQRPREGEQPLPVARRPLAEVAPEDDHPPVALGRECHADPGRARRVLDDGEQPAVEVARLPPDLHSGVGHGHPDPLRAGVGGVPPAGPRARTSGRVHDQVGVPALGPAAHAADSAALHDQRVGPGAADGRDVRPGGEQAAQHVLDQWPAAHRDPDTEVGDVPADPSRRPPVAGAGSVDVAHGAAFEARIAETRRQLLQRLGTAGEQDVGERALRRDADRSVAVGQRVPLEDHDPVEPRGERMGGREPGHAAAQHHRLGSSEFHNAVT